MRRGCEYEELAARYLESIGYRILSRNYRCREGEIDIIALDGEDLVFVEVKGGRDTELGHPAERFSPKKLSRILACAYAYMEERGATSNFRVDLVAVVGDQLQHFRNVGFDR